MYQQTWRVQRYGACGLTELGKTIDCNRSHGWRGGGQCARVPA
ncbi:MAG TPA: hypothetical protein VIG85_11355 [Comamonas sp.]|nr:hypothetical protein [Comamonas sp. NoAH]